MTKDEIAKLAARNTKPPDAEPLEELLWYWLRDMYSEFAAGNLDKQTGAEQKSLLYKRFDKLAAERDVFSRIVAARNKLWSDIELAHMAYNKERTIEAADQFVATVYGLMKRGDMSEWCNVAAKSDQGQMSRLLL